MRKMMMVKGSCFVLGTSISLHITFVNMLHKWKNFFIKDNCFLVETETLKRYQEWMNTIVKVFLMQV